MSFNLGKENPSIRFNQEVEASWGRGQRSLRAAIDPRGTGGRKDRVTHSV